MNAPAKLGAYAAGLALAFGGALGVGAAVGPLGVATSGDHADAHPAPHAANGPGGTTMEHGDQASGAAAAESGRGGHAETGGGLPGGLAVSQDGYAFVPASSIVPAGQEQAFRFTITGPDGAPLTGYAPEHDEDLHLIVVRRDLSGFQHLHPSRGPDGVWSQPLTLPAAGNYRAFADFVPAGGRALTLGVDLHAGGDYAPQPLPAPSRTALVDGYAVTLAGDLRAGASSEVTLSVAKDGQPVTDLEPYLAAYGHLVALRDGDLAYLHVHPEGHPGDGTTPAGPEIRFAAEVPTAGTYRLYLDFQHRGVVRTAEFTATAPTLAGPTGAPVPAPSATPPGAGTAPTATPTDPAAGSRPHPPEHHAGKEERR